MKAGDLVRFRSPLHAYVGDTPHGDKWEVGLLIEYHKWEKIATVLYDDQVLRIAARDVQKYGRRYLDEKG